MEKKTKQRILGGLVGVGLVIILLPLFQAKKEFTAEATLIQAPPFPDHAVQISATIPEPQQASTTIQTKPGEETNQPSDDIISSLHPSVVSTNNGNSEAVIEAPLQVGNSNQAAELAPASANNEVQMQTVTSSEKPPTTSAAIKVSEAELKSKAISLTATKHTAKIKKIAHNIKVVHSNKIQATAMGKPFDNNGLFDLKNPAWVIQIGNYKNKTNALRIVNQLRANGYRAFIQQVANTIGNGGSTRVFVGPENKQTAARALASRLENDFHIRGIVISYKPLTL